MAESIRNLDLVGQLQSCAVDQTTAIQTFCNYQTQSGPGTEEQAREAREKAVAVSTQIQALLTTPAELVQRLAREVYIACFSVMRTTTALIKFRTKYSLD